MKRLKAKIKGVIERKLGSGDSTHPLLKRSSKDFFERKEKTWRPMAALLLSAPDPVCLLWDGDGGCGNGGLEPCRELHIRWSAKLLTEGHLIQGEGNTHERS